LKSFEEEMPINPATRGFRSRTFASARQVISRRMTERLECEGISRARMKNGFE
jgi:hypothetical protein